MKEKVSAEVRASDKPDKPGPTPVAARIVSS